MFLPRGMNRSLLAPVICALIAESVFAATLEKLSLDQMSQKATSVIRGRVDSCAGEMRGPVIHTVCRVAVTETWKGATAKTADVSLPGGVARGVSQTFAGTPRLEPGQEYVLFLWAGRSGRNQLIGLSQGALAVQAGGKTGEVAVRAAADVTLLNSSGEAVQDDGLRMPVGELRARVRAAGASQ